jgi:[ribosomal protein S5]-alanine N-acetyltransferase
MEQIQKIIFCSPDPSFAAKLYEWRQDPIMKKYNPMVPATVESLRDRLAKSSGNLGDFEKVDEFFWFIQLNGQFVGSINCRNVDRQMLVADIGYTVISSARSKGIATHAVRTITQKIFSETPLRKLVANVHEGNLPSIRVLKNSGFKQEGLLREHYLINGQPANKLVFGLLRVKGDTF